MKLTEKQIIEKFSDKSVLDKLKLLFQVDDIKIRATELPVKNLDQSGRIDLVLEQRYNSVLDKTFILEFKRSRIKHSAVDQLKFYYTELKRKWYLIEEDTKGVLVAPDFSEYEIKEAKNNNFYCLQFDEKMNLRLR